MFTPLNNNQETKEDAYSKEGLLSGQFLLTLLNCHRIKMTHIFRASNIPSAQYFLSPYPMFIFQPIQTFISCLLSRFSETS